MKKPDPKKFATNEAYAEAVNRYNDYKAAKKETNRQYRKSRKAREEAAINEAKALKANRDIDPTREEWLMRAAKAILAHVATLGYEPTGEVKVALGIPPKLGRKCKTLGVCYHASVSEGRYREIFIHPEITDTRRLLGTLTHEIGHAVLKDGVGHPKPFGDLCRAVGFDFKKAAHADNGEAFWAWAEKIGEEIGPIPHKRLDCDRPEGGAKKQKARLLKLECPCCGIKLRLPKATLTGIYENTGSYVAQCIHPSCMTEIDFEDMLNELDEGDEE